MRYKLVMLSPSFMCSKCPDLNVMASSSSLLLATFDFYHDISFEHAVLQEQLDAVVAAMKWAHARKVAASKQLVAAAAVSVRETAPSSHAFCYLAAGSAELVQLATALLSDTNGAGGALSILQTVICSKHLTCETRSSFAVAILRPLLALTPRQLQQLLLQLLVGRDTPAAQHEAASKLWRQLLDPQLAGDASKDTAPGSTHPAGSWSAGPPADPASLAVMQLHFLHVSLVQTVALVFNTGTGNFSPWGGVAAAGSISKPRLLALQELLASGASGMAHARGVQAVFASVVHLIGRTNAANAEHLLMFKPLLGFTHGVLRLCAQPASSGWLASAVAGGTSEATRSAAAADAGATTSSSSADGEGAPAMQVGGKLG